MPLADTSRVQMSYLLESTFGVTPGSGTPKNIRMTGESISYSVSKETSNEIRSDRQLSDLIPVGVSAAGDINIEPSYREYDAFIEAVLQGTWAPYGTNGVTATPFTATFASGTVTAAVAPTGNDAFTNIGLGQWFRVNAAGDPNNGLYLKSHASTPSTTTVITLDAATPAVASAGVAGVTLSASRIVNGTTQRSFSMQRHHMDITQFFNFRGMTGAKMSLSLSNGALATGSFGFMGKDAQRGGTTYMPSAPGASYAFDVMNAVTGVGTILEAGSPLAGTFVKTLGFDYDNALRGRGAIGYAGNVSIGSGTIALTGTMDVYLADGTLYDKFVANTGSSIQFSLKDNAGNGYVFQMPRVKYGDARVNAGGKDQDAMISLPFTALQDPVSGYTMIVDRVGAAAA